MVLKQKAGLSDRQECAVCHVKHVLQQSAAVTERMPHGTYKHQHVCTHPHVGFAGVLEGPCASAAYNLLMPGGRAWPGACALGIPLTPHNLPQHRSCNLPPGPLTRTVWLATALLSSLQP
jgi:hypothetical protein